MSHEETAEGLEQKPRDEVADNLSGNGRDGVNTGGTPASWKAHLSLYEDRRVLTFATQKDLEAAIDLLWTAELRTLPHDTPNGKSIVVPAEAVGYFARAGLHFVEKRLRSLGELSADEIAKLRQGSRPT